MSSESALITVAVVVAALEITHWKIRRAWSRPSERDQIIAAARARTGLTVWDADAERWVHLPQGAIPGPGQMTGPDIAAADGLELLWNAPAYAGPDLDAGLEQLRRTIRDKQQKEAGDA